MASECIPTITTANFDSMTFDSAEPVIAFFGAERCSVCKELAPTVEEIAAEFADRLRVYQVDVDNDKNLATRFRLRGIPQILIFKNGEIAERMGGLQSKEDIVEVLNRVLAD